jgi:hypothetical protein
MNEENAFSLLQLTDQISRARQVQLTAIDQAVIRLNCAKSSGECRTAAGVAIFLAYLGTRVETLIRKEICAAYREIEKLQELPDQTQWDYRCAHTLGLSEGLNRAGAIQAKIIEQAQASLHKASILLMAQSEYNALPARALATKGPKSKFQLDCLQSIVQELNPRQGNRPGNANRLALQLSGAYLQRAISSQGSSDLTISTIFTTVCIPVKPAPYSGANRHSSQEAMLQGRSEATLT